DLPIVQVVAPASGEIDEGSAYVEHTENEVLVNSGEFTGLPAPEGKRRITEWLEGRGRGRAGAGERRRGWLGSGRRCPGWPAPPRAVRPLGHRGGTRGRAAGPPAGGRRLPAEGPLAARCRGGLAARALPRVRRRGAPRDGHDGHVRRLVLVLPPLHRSTQ